jgi:hypothetical protein
MSTTQAGLGMTNRTEYGSRLQEGPNDDHSYSYRKHDKNSSPSQAGLKTAHDDKQDRTWLTTTGRTKRRSQL